MTTEMQVTHETLGPTIEESFLDEDPLPPDPEAEAVDGPAEVPAETRAEGPAGDRAAPLEPPKRFTRQLVCKMYPEELAKKAVLLADAITDHDAYETEKKAVAADMAAALASKWEEVKRLSRVVHQGGEEREVECELVRNDREGSIETVRLDTGEVIDRRAQDVGERQLPLTAVVHEDDGPIEGLEGEQCITARDGERCESRVAPGEHYCPDCLGDAEAKRDARETEVAAARPRCAARVARGDNTEARCEEEAGESGFCGQHAEPCAAQGCTEPAMGAGLFCTGHSETVAKKRKRARKGDAAAAE